MDNKQLELLAPAGSRTSFEAALNNGADAVYLGIGKFSARRQAENFSIDDLENAAREAHLRGVKVYVAFNTIISDDELASAAENLARISEAGVDSVIVQDWGIFEVTKRFFPGLKVHASTQMNAHNVSMVKFLEQMGADRIVLARELSIDKIADICNSTDLQIETFIHGALCFSYSGQCLFSSMVGNRSGNRGLCSQACRMSYGLIAVGREEEVWPAPGRHLLSTRDLCGIRLIPELAKAGVKALKIEGRMKSPEYVATVVRIYRGAIDRYLKDQENFSVSEEEIDELREAFSRGFTEGYLKGIRDERLMSYGQSSDRGILLGRVTYLDVYKGRLGLSLKRELCVGDEIEIWVSRGGRVRTKVGELLVNDKPVQCAPAGSKAVIIISGKRHKINTGDRVFRVHNEKLIKKARATIAGAGAKKIPINVTAHIGVGKPIELRAHVSRDFGGEEARVMSDFSAEKGERRVLSESDVIAQLNRLGNTIYQVDSWNIDIAPGVMVPLGKLNELRRTLTEKLDSARLSPYERSKISVKKVKKDLSDAMEPERGIVCGKPLLTVDISTVEQAQAAVQNGADWLYVKQGFPGQAEAEISEVFSVALEKGVKLALAIGNILHQGEVEDLLGFIKSNMGYFDALLIDNFGLYHAVRSLNLPVFLDYHINNFNRLSSRLFRDTGASRICLSPELTLDQIKEITGSVDVEFEAMVHGWLEVMTAEHCVPSASKESCRDCLSKRFYIEDLKGFKFPIMQDAKCRSHIYNSRELYLLPNMNRFFEAGLASLRLLLNLYEPKIVGQLTAIYREAIDLINLGVEDIAPVLKKAEQIFHDSSGTTTGHFFREVY
ncbi:MAG: DUF3656 domain-containing protein [Actinobacteria bacterium]|nr:DUF3656 domain-containing protein [Actinomycetota bacterium]